MDKYYKINDKVKDYSIIKILGEGRYGIVYLAINDKGEKVVIKQLKKKMIKTTRKKLFYEEKILRKLNNPIFPKFIDKFKDKYRQGYILEYIDGVVFEDLIVREGYRFCREDIYDICEKLLDIIEILQKEKVVHRDIRLPNVIVRKNNELALIDFGLARFIDNRDYIEEIDYWYIGDFLLHLYYSSYEGTDEEEKPWFEELDINDEEKLLLKRLMGLNEEFKSIDEIRIQLQKIRDIN